MVVCNTGNYVNTMISAKGPDVIKKRKFETVIPPDLKAKKSVILKGRDKDLTHQTEEELKYEMETKNTWAKVEEVIKLKNTPCMLKLRFKDIVIANKAAEQDLSMGYYH